MTARPRPTRTTATVAAPRSDREEHGERRALRWAGSRRRTPATSAPRASGCHPPRDGARPASGQGSPTVDTSSGGSAPRSVVVAGAPPSASGAAGPVEPSPRPRRRRIHGTIRMSRQSGTPIRETPMPAHTTFCGPHSTVTWTVPGVGVEGPAVGEALDERRCPQVTQLGARGGPTLAEALAEHEPVLVVEPGDLELDPIGLLVGDGDRRLRRGQLGLEVGHHVVHRAGGTGGDGLASRPGWPGASRSTSRPVRAPSVVSMVVVPGRHREVVASEQRERPAGEGVGHGAGHPDRDRRAVDATRGPTGNPCRRCRGTGPG